MATCKRCGRQFIYDDEVGYAPDCCGAFCDGVLSQQAKIDKLKAIVKRLPRKDDIELAILAIGGNSPEAQENQCKCDPDDPNRCLYCAIESVLTRVYKAAAEAEGGE